MPRLLRQCRQLFERNRTAASIGLVLLLAAIGFLALHHLLLEVHLQDVRAAVHALQPWQLGAALGLTAASYLLLTLYDVLALRIIGKTLPWRTAALASFSSYTLSHNLGLSLLTGGSARYRVYSASGLEAADIMRIIATASMTFWSDVVVVAATALTLHPANIVLGPVVVPLELQRLLGLGVLAITAWLVFKARKSGQSLRIFGWVLPLPSAGQAFFQICLAGLDLAVASAALYVLVPDVSIQMFPLFFLDYTLAIIVALVTHVPGGIGVFEAVIIAALPDIDKSAMLAALVAYRAIYYLLPLLVAGVLLAVHERRQWRGPLRSALRLSQSAASGIAPMLLATLTFFGGAILMVSGSLPSLPYRLHMLRHVVPLPFVEASHTMAMPAAARIDAIAMSATEETTSQRLGREPHSRRRSRMA